MVEINGYIINSATITYVEDTFMVATNVYRLDIHFTSKEVLSFYTKELDEIKRWKERIKESLEKK